jgi:hypothetical protein
MMADSKAEPFEEDTNITTSSMSAIAVDPHIAASSASATVAIPDERSTAPVDVKSVLAADPDVIASNAFFRASLTDSAAVVGIAIPDERSTASFELLSSDVMMADSKAEPVEEDTIIPTSSMSAIAVDPHIAASSASATVAIPDDTGVGSALAVDSINATIERLPVPRPLQNATIVPYKKEMSRGTRVYKAAQAVSKTAVVPTTVPLKENLAERINSASGNMYYHEGNDIKVETFNRCILSNVSFVLLYINVLLYAQQGAKDSNRR